MVSVTKLVTHFVKDKKFGVKVTEPFFFFAQGCKQQNADRAPLSQARNTSRNPIAPQNYVHLSTSALVPGSRVFGLFRRDNAKALAAMQAKTSLHPAEPCRFDAVLEDQECWREVAWRVLMPTASNVDPFQDKSVTLVLLLAQVETLFTQRPPPHSTPMAKRIEFAGTSAGA